MFPDTWVKEPWRSTNTKVYFQGDKGRTGLEKPFHFKEIGIWASSGPTQDPLPLPLGVSLDRSASGPSNKSVCEASSEGTRRQDQLWFPWLWRGGEYSSSQGKSKLHSRPAMTMEVSGTSRSPKVDPALQGSSLCLFHSLYLSRTGKVQFHQWPWARLPN